MKNKVLIGIIIVLVGVIIVEGVYLFTSKEDGKENNSSINIPKEEEEENEPNDNETSEDYVKLVNTKEEDNQIIQEYEIYMNNKTNKLLLNYRLFEENMSDYIWFGLQGNYQNEEFYNFDRYSLENNDSNIANGKEYVEMSELLTIEFVNATFNENNFVFIEGVDDKTYLGVISKIDSVMHPDNSYLYIYNDNLELIGSLIIFTKSQTFIFNDNQNHFYNDNYSLCHDDCQIRLNIQGNQIHVLYYNPYCTDGNNIIDERIYTINNNVLEYEIVNSYSDEDFVIEGESC